jgi:hypothetical protein
LRVNPAGERLFKKLAGSSKQPETIVILNDSLRSGDRQPRGRKIIIGGVEDKSDVWLMKTFEPHPDR